MSDLMKLYDIGTVVNAISIEEEDMCFFEIDRETNKLRGNADWTRSEKLESIPKNMKRDGIMLKRSILLFCTLIAFFTLAIVSHPQIESGSLLKQQAQR